jgi:hypothetical protein
MQAARRLVQKVVQIRWPRVLAIAASLLLCVGNGVMASKPCGPAESAAPHRDVVVTGQILAWPVPRLLVLKVDRYYRGSGPQIVVAEHPGWLAPSSNAWRGYWRSRLHGWISPQAPWLYTFHISGNRWINSGCDPNDPIGPDMRKLIQSLGEGTPPEPGIGLHSAFIWDFPLKVGLLTAGWLLWRRLKRRKVEHAGQG